MIKVKKEGIILEPTKLAFENLSAYNPGVYQDGPSVHLFYRGQNEKYISCLGYAKLKWSRVMSNFGIKMVFYFRKK